jgi:hypothetical protein
MKRGEDGMRAPMGDVSMNDSLGDPMGDPCMAAWATLHPRAVQGALGGSGRRAASTRARDRRARETQALQDTGAQKTLAALAGSTPADTRRTPASPST